MSDMANQGSINPYESTQTDLDEQKPFISQGFFTAPMIDHLKAASPWMKFMGIISFIGAGFLILAGIIIVLRIPFLFQGIDLLRIAFAGSVTSILGIIYIVMGIIWIFPAKYLYTFASKIKLFIKTKDEHNMEIALSSNKSYWKFYGMLVIISLAFIPLMFVVSIFVAIGAYFI
jgi:hypothetical protein